MLWQIKGSSQVHEGWENASSSTERHFRTGSGVDQVNRRIEHNGPAPVGYEWCHSHKRCEPANDDIDYPVSDTFRDHFYESGLTPRPSATYVPLRDRILLDAIRELGEVVAGLAPTGMSETPAATPRPWQPPAQVKPNRGAIDL